MNGNTIDRMNALWAEIEAIEDARVDAWRDPVGEQALLDKGGELLAQLAGLALMYVTDLDARAGVNDKADEDAVRNAPWYEVVCDMAGHFNYFANKS